MKFCPMMDKSEGIVLLYAEEMNDSFFSNDPSEVSRSSSPESAHTIHQQSTAISVLVHIPYPPPDINKIQTYRL